MNNNIISFIQSRIDDGFTADWVPKTGWERANTYDYTYMVEGMLFAGGTAELIKTDSKYEGREDANGITNIEIQPIVYTDKIVSFGLSEDWSNQSEISFNKQNVRGFEHRVFAKENKQT